MIQEDKKINWFLILISVSSLAVIFMSFWSFYFKKDYEFIVETPCDSSKEECTLRDCSNSDDCPPNQLSQFKRYTIMASDFKHCTNEECAMACEEGEIGCEKMECVEDPEFGESCVSMVLDTELQ